MLTSSISLRHEGDIIAVDSGDDQPPEVTGRSQRLSASIQQLSK